MKIYVKAAEDVLQDNLTNFESVLSNLQRDVNRAVGTDVITKLTIDDDYRGSRRYFTFDIIRDLDDIEMIQGHDCAYFKDYFKNYRIVVVTWGHTVGVSAEDATSIVPKSQIQSWYSELVDSLVSQIQDLLDALGGEDLESYYQDWYESEIEPQLAEAFPGCNFSTKLGSVEFTLMFSKKDNPDYSGRTLSQALAGYVHRPDYIKFIAEHGYPKDWDKNFIVKMAQKLIKRGVDVNRQLVSQERKEARKREEQAIDMNEISEYMYEYFGRYLEDQLPDYDPNLLRISNITINRKSGRIDFDAILTYDGISVKVWMPFERDQSKDIYPYGYNYDKNMSSEMINKMYRPLEKIVDQYT